MNQEEIIRMAREANLPSCHTTHPKALERFAVLVAAHARETEAAKWAKGAKISVPTRVMEQQFSIYYRRGYEAGVLVNKEKRGLK